MTHIKSVSGFSNTLDPIFNILGYLGEYHIGMGYQEPLNILVVCRPDVRERLNEYNIQTNLNKHSNIFLSIGGTIDDVRKSDYQLIIWENKDNTFKRFTGKYNYLLAYRVNRRSRPFINQLKESYSHAVVDVVNTFGFVKSLRRVV